MSLADQSQTWYPTSVQVTVVQARNLRIKGKNGTNDAYAIMQVAKDKFSTSVAEKCVAPVWKEEAAFDLPLFHQSNAERCTLYIIVMHRAHVGLDKHLGQAVVNLLDLHDSKSRKKTEWFKLVDKNGKEDKVRGEVLLDIQFMRNNMSASMFDLSMQDKPRSRISKLKDKVRGKKKDGFSDSASAIVPSTSQALTDSEGEAETHSPETKKKSKLKSLFGPKSNLQRNISQSMSTLGSLPEKNSSLSGSRSSGLNVESPDVKKKFKFLGHKRTGSNDSKVSLGPFSILGRSKPNANDQNNLCINGSHVYAEEAEPKSGSTLSLSSSGQGSVEDVRRHNSDISIDSLKGLSVPSYRQEAADRDRAQQQEQQRPLEEEERRQAEEKRRADAKRLHEEEEKEQKQQEQERRKLLLEDEAARKKLEEERKKKLKVEEEERKKKLKVEEEERKKKLKEEEEERKKRQEEEKRRLVEERRQLQAQEDQERQEEEQRQQEEAKKAEDQKRQEEASMTDRLSTLFGMIKKKEDPQPQNSNTKEQGPKPAPRSVPRDPEVPQHSSNPFEEIPDPEVPHHSANPFEDVSLSQDPSARSVENTLDHQKPQHTPQAPSAMVFLNRTAKVSAVKPRLIETQKPETPDSHTQGPPPSPSSTESSLSSVPSESPVTFSSLHSSLAPPNTRTSSSESPQSCTENLTVVFGSPPTMAERKRQAPLPPAHGTPPDPATQMKPQSNGTPSGAFRSSTSKPVACGGFLVPIRENEDTEDGEVPGAKPGQRPSLPLPDYESLFPVKRHGVQGQTRWDHIIAEVNQKQRDYMPQLAAKEMSVDGPEEVEHSYASAPLQVKTALRPSPQKTQPKESQPTSLKKGPAPPPPKPVAASPRPVPDITPTQNQRATPTNTSVEMTNVSSSTVNLRTSSREIPSMKPREDLRKVLKISSNDVDDAKSVRLVEAPRPVSPDVLDARLANDQSGTPSNIPKETPTAKPRQKIVNKETERQADPKVTSQDLTLKEQVIQPKLRTASPDLTETSSVLIKHTQVNAMRLKKPTPDIPSKMDKKQILEKVMKAKEKLVEPDPFPSSEVLSRDPWSFPEQSLRADDLFTGTTQKDHTLKDQGITTDLENPFATDNSTDPFSTVDISDSEEQLEQSKADVVSNKDSVFQRGFSHRSKQASVALSSSEKKGALGPKAEETTTTSESPGLDRLQSQVDSSRQNYIYGGETKTRSEQKAMDPFVSSSPSTVPSVLTTPEPYQAGVEETAPQPGALSGGRTQLKAWVSPSEAQLNSNGGGPALTPRRPHPVKPMSTGEVQASSATPAVRELKTLDSSTGKIKGSGTVDSGPYCQLTQEELITLVVKQQDDLSKKNAKIVELEEYIDNLLVRVIEEKPSLLLGLTSTKQAL